MKRLLTIGLAALALGLGGGAAAQQTTMSRSHVTPNGGVQTTTRTVGPNGSATTRTVERPNGERTVVRSRTDVRGDRTVVRSRTDVRGDRYVERRDRYRGNGYAFGGRGYRVCRVHWQHHRRVRRCIYRHRARGRY
ncbi:MAG: hypothetical protein J2O44_02240 [Porphyrobacter sp.]|nr:hypothetical protein [Porphyrobacter sp.]